MKLFKIFLAGALLLALMYGLLIVGLKSTFDREIQAWAKRTQGRSFEIQDWGYRSMRPAGLGVRFNQIFVQCIVRYDYPYLAPRHFNIQIPLASLGLKMSLRRGLRLAVMMEGLDAQGEKILEDEKKHPMRIESVESLSLQALIPVGLNPARWKKNMKSWAQQFKKWIFQSGDLEGIQLSGNAVFFVNGISTKVFLRSQVGKDRRIHLEGDSRDLERLVHLIEPKFTAADIKLAANNLLKTPRLLDIRTRAEVKAEKMYDPKSGISYDTPRHIFWSYWLTKAFGAEFALHATDAHEIGDFENSPEEHAKDLYNNSLGIEYAQKQLSEKEVEEMIYSDTRIPREARSAGLGSASSGSGNGLFE